ncbi:MAG: siderophore-interacting protein [Bacteroidota bacterium]
MPTLPIWMANTMEKVFNNQFHPVMVKEVNLLTSGLKLVRFKGDLSKTSFTPGKVIEFRVSDREFRHYTPSFFDKKQGVCEVLFYLHGLGIGSKWAEDLKVGDETKLMGPGGKMALEPAQDKHVLFGDESSLGLFVNVFHHSNTIGKCLGVLELDQKHQRWPDVLGLEVPVVKKSKEHPATHAVDWLNTWTADQWALCQHTTFYLTGRAKSIQSIRNTLKNKGIKSKQIQSMPYWADHKKGL